LLISAIIHLLKLIEADAKEAKEVGSVAIADKLWKVRAYMCTLMVASLRGHKCFYLDLAGVRKHIHKGRMGVVPDGIDKNTVLSEEKCWDLPHPTICL
jgi:hypothetical protein